MTCGGENALKRISRNNVTGGGIKSPHIGTLGTSHASIVLAALDRFAQIHYLSHQEYAYVTPAVGLRCTVESNT